MKTKYFSLLFPILLLLFACNKDLEVASPSFNVSGYTLKDAVDSLGNHVKQVVFNLQGNADVVSFFSGELLHEYEYREDRIVGTDEVRMSFIYNGQLGLGTIIRENQLSVQASTDFNGEATQTSIESANWTDISERFSIKLVTDVPDGAYITTEVSISDLVVKGKPLYIAFKYDTPPQTADERYSRWQIRSFEVVQGTVLGQTSLFSQSATPLILYHKGPFESGRTSSNTTQVQFRGNIATANRPIGTEDWALSPGIIIQDDLDLGPDRPITIKNRIDPVLGTYSYNYPNKPGTYKVAFVANNVTTKGEAKVVKEVEVVIP